MRRIGVMRYKRKHGFCVNGDGFRFGVIGHELFGCAKDDTTGDNVHGLLEQILPEQQREYV
jgi:hypothetical protein